MNAQPAPAPPAAGGYVCLDNHCRPSNVSSVGVPQAWCNAICGTAALKYKCIDYKCVPDDGGIPYESCESVCIRQ